MKLDKNNFCKVLCGILIFLSIFIMTGCREYDKKLDVVYFFKTEPEKAVLDFMQSLNNEDTYYIYDNLLPNNDKNNISREKFAREFVNILSDVDVIEVKKTVYLGYENNMSKVVAEFEIRYRNGEVKQYKKYIYLIEENNKWKIVFKKTFI